MLKFNVEVLKACENEVLNSMAFREEFDNCAFVYVSDDMAWGRNNLKNEHGDLFFAGAGENLVKI